MKRNSLILLFLLPALLLASCTPQIKQSPTETVQTFLDALKRLDFAQAKTLADSALNEKIAGLEKQLDDAIARAMLEKLMSIVRYEVLSETKEDKTASVTLNISGLTEEAMRSISEQLILAGFAISDPLNTEELHRSVEEAVNKLDMESLSTVFREVELTLTKEHNAWVIGEDALTKLTEALIPVGF